MDKWLVEPRGGKKKKSDSWKLCYLRRIRPMAQASASKKFRLAPDNIYSFVPKIKCVLLGDSGIGKTDLALWGLLQLPATPATEDLKASLVYIDGLTVQFELCDLPGGREYKETCRSSYIDASIFVICFSVLDPNSFWNVKERWIPEIQKYAPHVPRILVGMNNKVVDPAVLDELAARGLRPIESAEGHGLACEINAVGNIYIEYPGKDTAAFVFETAMREWLNMSMGGSSSSLPAGESV
jgi:Ras-related C3 botulinum toxin substrate 1